MMTALRFIVGLLLGILLGAGFVWWGTWMSEQISWVASALWWTGTAMVIWRL